MKEEIKNLLDAMAKEGILFVDTESTIENAAIEMHTKLTNDGKEKVIFIVKPDYK